MYIAPPQQDHLSRPIILRRYLAVSAYEFVVTNMSAFSGKYETQKGLVLVTSLQAEKKACFHRLEGGYWTDFHQVVGFTELDAFATWAWFRKFGCFDDIVQTADEVQNILISADELNDLRKKK
jgi:hypothetical protein